jgi:hypothetical protein
MITVIRLWVTAFSYFSIEYRPALGKMWLTTIMRNINFVVDPDVWTGLTPFSGSGDFVGEFETNLTITIWHVQMSGIFYLRTRFFDRSQIIVDVGNKKSRNNLMWLKGKLSYNDGRWRNFDFVSLILNSKNKLLNFSIIW